MESLTTKAKWRHVSTGHCAYRGKSTLGKRMCNHLLSLTTDCQFVTCPIIQDKYISFQRKDETVYLTEKDSKKKFNEAWVDTELSGDSATIKADMGKKLKGYSPQIAQLATKKLDYLLRLADEYRASLAESEANAKKEA